MPHDSLEFQNKWHSLPLAEQFGNIGSEISRAIKWKEKDPEVYQRALDRAFDLIDLSMSDPRWRGRLKEIVRFRESVGDAMEDGAEYQSSFEALERYCTQFVALR